MSDMVEVLIDSVRVSLMSPQRVVVLKQKDAERYLPIWVGPFEAEAISVALQEVEVSRPLTHDLLKNVFEFFQGRILRVEVVSLRDDTFYGSIVVEKDGQTQEIDSRPSDAIALGVRAHVPILVNEEVMQAAGIIPERDLQQDEQPSELTPQPPPEPDLDLMDGGEERLDVFEDFLKNLGDQDGEEKPQS
ncbi:MAG: bifunctional nuclease family protein [Anaerolineales bacterium]|nr:bifunctional nuclease family protein [Anaerolineales bacterium]